MGRLTSAYTRALTAHWQAIAHLEAAQRAVADRELRRKMNRRAVSLKRHAVTRLADLRRLRVALPSGSRIQDTLNKAADNIALGAAVINPAAGIRDDPTGPYSSTCTTNAAP